MRAALVLAAALAALVSGCGAPDGTETADREPAPPAGEATFQMGPGLYSVGSDNTVYARTRLDADGTYTDMTGDGEVVGGGTWSTRSDMICFDPAGDGEDQSERCWTNGPPSSDGSFISTRVGSDESYRVTPIEE